MNNQQFVMVSEWMANGNINQFVEAHMDVDRFERVSSYTYRQQHPPLTTLICSSKASQEG